MGAINGPSWGMLNCTRRGSNISISWCIHVHLSLVEISDLLGSLATPRLALLGPPSILLHQKFISLLQNLSNLSKIFLDSEGELICLSSASKVTVALTTLLVPQHQHLAMKLEPWLEASLPNKAGSHKN